MLEKFFQECATLHSADWWDETLQIQFEILIKWRICCADNCAPRVSSLVIPSVRLAKINFSLCPRRVPDNGYRLHCTRPDVIFRRLHILVPFFFIPKYNFALNTVGSAYAEFKNKAKVISTVWWLPAFSTRVVDEPFRCRTVLLTCVCVSVRGFFKFYLNRK